MAAEEEKSSNKAGIPEAIFVDDVDGFMSQSENESAEKVLRRLDEQHQKYKFMELNLNTKKRRLRAQVPDIKGTLDTVRHLAKNDTETLDTQFMLADNLYVKAKVPPTKKVGLWLGANIMLEYSLEEAEALLEKNWTQAKTALDVRDAILSFIHFIADCISTTRTTFDKRVRKLKSSEVSSHSFLVDDDLGYLRDQTTTTEVSMARVYNWDVKRRQQTKTAVTVDNAET